ncbi:hypothetical protein D3C83_50330 [compost metagenome]
MIVPQLPPDDVSQLPTDQRVGGSRIINAREVEPGIRFRGAIDVDAVERAVARNGEQGAGGRRDIA